MTEADKTSSNESMESNSIRIEIPGASFEAMCRMMAELWGVRKDGPGCCGPGSEGCCPPFGKSETREFTFELKRKE